MGGGGGFEHGVPRGDKKLELEQLEKERGAGRLANRGQCREKRRQGGKNLCRGGVPILKPR